IRLITIFEDEWLEKRAIVESKLKHLFGLNKIRVQARKCNIVRLSHSESYEFLEKTHLQGGDYAPVRYGLKLGEELVAVATVGRPSKSGGNREYQWNVSRYACALEHNVVGGWGKLLQCFIREHQPKSLIT